MNRLLGWVLAGLFFQAAAASSFAQQDNKDRPSREQFKPAKQVVYKTVGDAKLTLDLFLPEGHKATDRRPAIVFFFGGGWTSGSPSQFYPHCQYLASRGMVAASADYRVKSRHDVTPFECVADAKSAVRYLRGHADEFGIDPKRLAAGGGSAGGHLAACCGTIVGLDEQSEEQSIGSQPNALVLFNPAVMLSADPADASSARLQSLKERFKGRDPKQVSPYDHIAANQPPTIIFHGTADTAVPFRTVEQFTAAMKKAGNRCELAAYEGQTHGFFNFGRSDKFFETVSQMDSFLTSLGYLEGTETVEKFKQSLLTK